MIDLDAIRGDVKGVEVSRFAAAAVPETWKK